MRRRPLLLPALLALCLAVTRAPPAEATVMATVTVDELAREADLVVVATPSPGRHAFWRQGRIVTEVRCVTTTVLKGSARVGADVIVRLPGGVVGEVAQALAGAPVLEDGIPVVLFLSAPRDGSRTVHGLAAGVLPMATNRAGAVVVMPARTEGITFLPAAVAPHPRIVVPPEGMPLQRLADLLREVTR